MRSNQLLPTVLAAVMVLSLIALPGLIAAAADDEGGLEIDAEQADELVTVTVTDDGDGVENATVNATLTDDESDWAEVGETDADGQLNASAPNASTAPNDTIDVTFETTVENETAETQVAIDAIDDEPDLAIDVHQNDGVLVEVTDNATAVENATVNATSVSENVTYADEGTHATDENGTVALSAPNETVDVTFNATVDNASVETTETLESADDDEPSNFGSLVSQFVEENRDDTDGPFGQAVSSFVVENNPGNASDNAGPPAHAGPGGDDESDDNTSQGPPSHAGPHGDDGSNNDSDDGQGPPAHAAVSDGDADDDDADDDGDDGDDGDDDGQGPPSHAGPHGDE